MAAHVHRISLEDLLFQRTSETATLLRKADRAARLVLGREIQAGEVFRVIEPGMYHVLFPNLTPNAGLARASELKAKLRHELRHFDPNARKSGGRRAEPQGPAQGETPRAAPQPAHPPQPETLSVPNPQLQQWAPPRLEFHPVWNIQTNMITGYRCVLNAEAAAHMEATHRDLES
jgi:hypothetical protein